MRNYIKISKKCPFCEENLYYKNHDLKLLCKECNRYFEDESSKKGDEEANNVC